MLKKIPSEQPAARVNGKKRISKTQSKRRDDKAAPCAILQKKNTAVSKDECRIIHIVGARMLNYGKKAFKTHEEYRRLIRDVQISVLCLQKQQRKFLRSEHHKKNES